MTGRLASVGEEDEADRLLGPGGDENRDTGEAQTRNYPTPQPDQWAAGWCGFGKGLFPGEGSVFAGFR